MKRSISPFSVVLIAVALSVVGIASLRMLSIQHKPSDPGSSIRVSWSMSGASAELIEAEVTSKIEGVLSGLSGCSGTSSVSRKGSGEVNVSFAKGTDMAAARFDVASAVRNIYMSLPDNVTYPSISLNAGGGKSVTAVTYLLKGSLPSRQIQKYAENSILTPLSRVEGVDKVQISGGTPFHWVITFDSERVKSLGIKASEIQSAFSAYYSDNVIGLTDSDDGNHNLMAVRLAFRDNSGDDPDFGSIPVKKSGDKVVYLSDIATWRYEESLPSSYYRINGLNTVTLNVTLAPAANLLTTVSAVKNLMSGLQDSFPQEITASIGYDASEYVSGELKKIYVRTGLCLLILLLFVFLVNHSWRNMLVMALTLAVNLLISIAIYAFSGITVHIYTLAGITVSLGIVIDTSIVMIDHYSYWKNRGAFPDMVAAVLTTVGALLLILLLPESERGNLTDFIWVIVINLSVSLVVSYFFIPALMHYIPILRTSYSFSLKRRRRVLKWNRLYSRYIGWGVRHRWVYVVLFIIAFGIPLFLIPAPKDKERGKFYEKVVRPVVSWAPYANNRNVIDKYLGSTFGLFSKSLDRSNFYREPQKTVLHINAGMLEGCSVQQLNEVVKSMENYLASFDEISLFTTRVTSYDNAVIDVEFKPEYLNTGFPSSLKAQVTSMAINFGGANWRVYGVDDQYFNNNIVSNGKSHRIILKGYNYRQLYSYAEDLVESLSKNSRVSAPEIWAGGYYGRPAIEFALDYDFEKISVEGVNPYKYYNELQSLLYDNEIGHAQGDGERVSVELKSSDTDKFDLWHVLNEPVSVDSSKVTLNDVGSIVKKLSGIEIKKDNQSYELNVCFDFVGSYELSKKFIGKQVTYLNEEVLPVGFKAESPSWGWFERNKDRYAWLILLIIVVIYVMLAMTFESYRYPFAVIFMIPVSFIGLFLVFGLSDFSFDQGGFAAFVMLCGIVVNAGIYLINTYKSMRNVGDDIRRYVKAYNHKINPIMLTISSTVLGLLPFLSDGPEEVFWFDFAIGTISGMVFSVIALIFILPAFVVRPTRRSRRF